MKKIGGKGGYAMYDMKPNEKERQNMIYSQLFQNDQYAAMNKSPVEISDIENHSVQTLDIIRYNRDEIQESISMYADMVYRIALIHSGNTDTADIIYQKTFLKFIRNKEYVPAGETRKRWFIREVVNSKIKRRGYPSIGGIVECVYKLPKRKRIIFHLHFYENYSLSEIAGFLKGSEREITDYIESCLKEMPKILQAERIWESENYIARYQEEMNSVKHDFLLDEKIKDKANKPIPKITGKTIKGYIVAFAIALFCLWGAWDTLINAYHFDKSFTYFFNSIPKVEVHLDKTEMVEFSPEQFRKAFGVEMNFKQNRSTVSKNFDTYEEFYKATGIEIFGADALEWENLYFYVDSSHYPLLLNKMSFQIYNYGSINCRFTYLEEEYHLKIIFKINDFTSPDEILDFPQYKANYSYKYEEDKYAAFICNGMTTTPISQDIYFVEDGILYVLRQVDATLEATEKVKNLLDLMAANE